MSYGGNILSEERDGVKIWDLSAENMEVEVETQIAELRNLKAHFYQKDGKVVDYRIEYCDDFIAQQLEYGEKYATL